MTPNRSIAARVARSARLLPVLALAFAAGCNLDVVTPTVVPPASTQGEGALPTLLAGAVGDFALAYGGYNNGNAGEGIALHGGLFADEFISADYFSTHREVDRRLLTVSNASNSTVTLHLMQALGSAQRTAAAYAAVPSQTNSAGHARALSLGGTIYTIVAEDYCSGIPFSTVDAEGRPLYGTSKTTAEILALAVAKFDSAITVASAAVDSASSAGSNADIAASTAQLNFARVGKGRALLDAGQYAAAAAAVASVPTSFVFATEQGTVDDRTKNGIYSLTFISSRFTTADREGTNGQPFVSARDPRVPTRKLGTSRFDGSTTLYAPTKFGAYDAPIPIATGTEARLIEAEAKQRAGDYGAALVILNSLRSSSGMTPLTAATTPEQQVDQIFAERAFWLFGTAHRLGDLRRLVKQYGRAQSTVFPSGNYFKGDIYGNQVNLLVPQEEEQDNPNFSRASCDPTKP
ncbi:MAG: RagB/SusD protein [Gemmatimonadetes bacterium]|jgi:hypothetical protein|nr:RagB/SusD protein [Gemmatimonadota bacterium]